MARFKQCIEKLIALSETVCQLKYNMLKNERFTPTFSSVNKLYKHK